MNKDVFGSKGDFVTAPEVFLLLNEYLAFYKFIL
jgi:SAM-dependent MidA family methyltransferase